MNIIRSSIKNQVLYLKTLPIFSPLKRGVKSSEIYCFEVEHPYVVLKPLQSVQRFIRSLHHFQRQISTIFKSNWLFFKDIH